MTEVAIDFATYGTKPSGDRSGAYLFLPDGPAEVSAFWSVAGQYTESYENEWNLHWIEWKLIIMHERVEFTFPVWVKRHLQVS